MDEYDARLKGKWDNFYCFEADPDIFEKLKDQVEEKNIENVYLYNVGCWDEKTIHHFEQAGSGSSSITELDADVDVKADKIDHVLKGKPVSIIKMDIEGAEQNALRGAEETIKTQRPKFAVSIYHSLEDFIKIPEIFTTTMDTGFIYVTTGSLLILRLFVTQ